MPLAEKNPLSSNAIKLIAIAAMTVDHIAWAVFPGYPKEFLPLLMHIIGRITCPIMCYCIAESYISLPSTACTAFCIWALRSRCRFCGSITGSAAKAPP